MTNDDILNVVAEALQKEEGTVTIDDNQNTVEEWDSLGHLSIIAVVNATFGVSLDNPNFKTIRELIDSLKRLGVLDE